MARVKISEYRAKTMLAAGLGVSYEGVSVDTTQALDELLASLLEDKTYVVKVDQAIKKRMKQGLAKLNLGKSDVESALHEFGDKGFRYCLVEPMFTHDAAAEHYVSFTNDREGTHIAWSSQGGIDIEEAADSIQTALASDENLDLAASGLSVPVAFLKNVRATFDAAYGCFLEINPLVSNGDHPMMLDVAAEMDGEASYLTRSYWTNDDVRSYRQLTPEEALIADLASKSRASLRYEIINPNGAVWLLLSGGGASVTVADEVHNRGYGELLGNYGEYSGNPSEPETFAYTEQLLQSLLKSSAAQKVLIIAGGVANFTDVRTTFSGVIRAFNKYADQLQSQGVKVYVRRGGPHEVEGLALISEALSQKGLLGAVHGPELPLAESVSTALASLETRA